MFTPYGTKTLNVSDAAKHLGLSKSYLDKARVSGNGPSYIKLGRRVVYQPSDLDAWLASNRRRSTTAPL
jgi:predicted DNA-binding transcriptional regulator AlpA